MERKNFNGLDGFVWFIGIVENRLDPLNLNRVQVRCFGWHTDNKTLIPTKDLPWAVPTIPYTESFTSASPKEGDMVFGFFTDGSAAQFPIIIGILPGIPEQLLPRNQGFTDPRTDEQLSKSPKKPSARAYATDGSGVTIIEKQATRYPNVLNEPTTSRVARNETIKETLIQERKDNVVEVPSILKPWKEPVTKYDAVFPYNRVTESESGHLFEIDDTPGKERLSKTHRSGTFEEVHPDGSKVTKVVGDNYEIVMKDDHVYVMGNCKVTIQGNADILVRGDMNTKVEGDYNLKVAGNYNLDVAGKTNERHDDMYSVWYGDDTLTRKQSGKTDYRCPSDERNSGQDCSDVPGLWNK